MLMAAERKFPVNSSTSSLRDGFLGLREDVRRLVVVTFFGGISILFRAASAIKSSTSFSSTSVSRDPRDSPSSSDGSKDSSSEESSASSAGTDKIMRAQREDDAQCNNQPLLTFKPLANTSRSCNGLSSTDLFQLSANESCEALVGLVWPLLVESLDVGCAVVVWINRAAGMEE